MSETIINPRPPTERDLRILAYLNEGNTIDSAKALGLFKTTGLRDCLYRLRKAGHIIHHKDISYKTKEGEGKYYRTWFTVGNTIIENGAKTKKEQLKGTKPIAEITQKMADIGKQASGGCQVSLFP